MSCLVTSGWAKGCKDNRGGLKKVLIANVLEVSTFTEGTTGASPSVPSGEIIGITMSATASVWYEFVPNKASSNWVENIQANPQNGTVGYEQVVDLMFAKNEAAKRNQVQLLAEGEVYIIAHDYNDKMFLIGEFNGAELTGGNSSSGTALTDMNGWQLNFTANEPYPAKEVKAGVLVDNSDGTWSAA
jgi:hypothetical protein